MKNYLCSRRDSNRPVHTNDVSIASMPHLRDDRANHEAKLWIPPTDAHSVTAGHLSYSGCSSTVSSDHPWLRNTCLAQYCCSNTTAAAAAVDRLYLHSSTELNNSLVLSGSILVLEPDSIGNNFHSAVEWSICWWGWSRRVRLSRIDCCCCCCCCGKSRSGQWARGKEKEVKLHFCEW